MVDDLEVIRSGLELGLRRSGASMVEMDRAELVVVGPHLPRAASDVVAELKTRAGNRHVVHLALRVDAEELVALLRAGVDALVPLSISSDELAEVIQRVVGGERIIRGVHLEAVRPSLNATAGAETELTQREHQVLSLLATRRTFAEVAAELFVSPATVKSHASRVYTKLGVNGRQEAVERAVALRLLG